MLTDSDPHVAWMKFEAQIIFTLAKIVGWNQCFITQKLSLNMMNVLSRRRLRSWSMANAANSAERQHKEA